MEQYNYKVLKHMNMNYKTVITHDLTLRFINISIQYTETIHSQNIFITDNTSQTILNEISKILSVSP